MKTKYRVIAEGQNTKGLSFYKKSETNDAEQAYRLFEKLKAFCINHNIAADITILSKWGSIYAAERAESV